MPVRPSTLLDWYHQMWRIRKFEETCLRLFRQNLIPGSIHLCIGQEAVAVGACAALRPDDVIFATYRGHGHCLAKGADSKRLMAEMLGRRDGVCNGKGGSLHLADVSVGVMGTNGIVGAGIPHAVGAALAISYRGGDQVAVAFFGEGATNQGAFHEAANLAAIWNLPVIFVCENNLYSEMTPIAKMVRVQHPLADRATAYGIPGVVVDGNDPECVYTAMVEAVARARSGHGPTCIEAMTYRLVGHNVGDTGGYRAEEEVEAYRAREPIVRLRARLLELGVPEAELGEREEAAEAEIAAAAAFAQASPRPDAAELLTDVYVL